MMEANIDWHKVISQVKRSGVEALNCEEEKGVIFVLGPQKSGKSTLINCFMGGERPGWTKTKGRKYKIKNRNGYPQIGNQQGAGTQFPSIYGANQNFLFIDTHSKAIANSKVHQILYNMIHRNIMNSNKKMRALITIDSLHIDGEKKETICALSQLLNCQCEEGIGIVLTKVCMDSLDENQLQETINYYGKEIKKMLQEEAGNQKVIQIFDKILSNNNVFIFPQPTSINSDYMQTMLNKIQNLGFYDYHKVPNYWQIEEQIMDIIIEQQQQFIYKFQDSRKKLLNRINLSVEAQQKQQKEQKQKIQALVQELEQQKEKFQGLMSEVNKEKSFEEAVSMVGREFDIDNEIVSSIIFAWKVINLMKKIDPQFNQNSSAVEEIIPEVCSLLKKHIRKVEYKLISIRSKKIKQKRQQSSQEIQNL